MTKEDLLVNSQEKIASGFNHSFDTGIAMKCGVEAAILYNNLCYWITHNKINEVNLINGRTWTYDSMEKMNQYVPYLSIKQIRNGLESLLNAGIILRDNFNKNKMDRRFWYALVDESVLNISNNSYDYAKKANAFAETEKCIMPKGQMQLAKRANDHNTDTILTDNNNSSKVPEDSAVAVAAEAAEVKIEIPKKKVKTPSEFTPTVRKVAEQMLAAMQRVKPNYVPPANLAPFMTSIELMMRRENRDQQLILDVFSWALTDPFWTANMFTQNPAEYLRKKFDSLEMKMTAKPASKVDRRLKDNSGRPIEDDFKDNLF